MRIQGSDIKTLADLGGAGNESKFITDQQIFISANGLNKSLKDAIEANDLVSGVPSATITTVSSGPTYDMSASPDETCIRHTSASTVTYQLPTASATVRQFTFIHRGAPSTSINEIRIQPASGDQIKFKNDLVVNPGYISIPKFGCSITMACIDANSWIVVGFGYESHEKNSTIGYPKNISLVGRDSWVTKATGGTGRSGPCAFQLNGYGYIAGGSATLTEVNQYDDIADSWATKAVLPAGRGFATGFSFNGYGYACGGDGPTNATHKYDDVGNSWATKAVVPTSRYGSAGFALNGYGYKIGGGDGGSNYADVYRYNDSADSWSSVTSLPSARIYGAAFALNGYQYHCNGLDAGGTKMNTVNQYNDSANAWIQKANGGTARYGLSGFSINEYGYICDGDDGVITSEVNQYNDSLNTWTTKTANTTARMFCASFALNGFGYVCNGSTGSVSNVVEQYN